MPFRLAIVVSSNPINFIKAYYLHHAETARNTMRIGLLLTAVTSQNEIHSRLV